ncbi:hypothetical protein EV426DRAFT_707114 [Tirmania nivea]|nr:hypothetical protein EV426DRAFT_707114 [Tirmania nivea]
MGPWGWKPALGLQRPGYQAVPAGPRDWRPVPGPQRPGYQGQAQQRLSEVQCYKCSGWGHVRRSCTSISRTASGKIGRKAEGTEKEKGKKIDEEGFEVVQLKKARLRGVEVKNVTVECTLSAKRARFGTRRGSDGWSAVEGPSKGPARW